MNGLQVCQGNLGEDHILAGPLKDVSPPPTVNCLDNFGTLSVCLEAKKVKDHSVNHWKNQALTSDISGESVV